MAVKKNERNETAYKHFGKLTGFTNFVIKILIIYAE